MIPIPITYLPASKTMCNIDMPPGNASKEKCMPPHSPDSLRKHIRIFADSIWCFPQQDLPTPDVRILVARRAPTVSRHLTSPNHSLREFLVRHLKAFPLEIATLTFVFSLLGFVLWLLERN